MFLSSAGLTAQVQWRVGEPPSFLIFQTDRGFLMQDKRPAQDRLPSHDDTPAFKIVQRDRRLNPTKQERRQSEVLFRKLLESAPDAVVIAAEDGTIVLANSRAVEMFGYTTDELVGMSVEALVPDDVRPNHIEHRRQYADNPHVRPMGGGKDLKARRKDGSVFAGHSAPLRVR